MVAALVLVHALPVVNEAPRGSRRFLKSGDRAREHAQGQQHANAYQAQAGEAGGAHA